MVEQEEEIAESLKNILYFMKGDGYLVPPNPKPTPTPTSPPNPTPSSSNPDHHPPPPSHPSEPPQPSQTDSSKAADQEIWSETWKRVDSFLPGMRREIFPDPPPPPQPAAPPPPSADAGEGK